jgi:hypothetical protein
MVDEIITFADPLPEDDRRIVKAVLSEKIARRRSSGFGISQVTVKGAAVVGAGERRKMLAALTQVSYTEPGEQEPTGYHLGILPDAATLLVVFRILGRRMTTRPTPDSHHVFLITQARLGPNAPRALEIAGGLLNKEDPIAGAIREFMEEGVAERFRKIFPEIRREAVRRLAPPAVMHPFLADDIHMFYTELDMDAATFNELKRTMNGTKAGNRRERENTRVAIMTFREAFWECLTSNKSPLALNGLTQYGVMNGLLGLTT